MRFRCQLYASLTARADALFELTDAVLCSDGPVTSLVELTLLAEHRRGHGAMYDALNQGRVEPQRLRRTLASLPLEQRPRAGRRSCPHHAAGADAEPYEHVPSYWSDLDTPAGRLRLRSVGHTADADAVHVLDGDLATGRALISYGRAGRLVGAVSLDRPRHLVTLRAQIAQGAEFPGRLPAVTAGAA